MTTENFTVKLTCTMPGAGEFDIGASMSAEMLGNSEQALDFFLDRITHALRDRIRAGRSESGAKPAEHDKISRSESGAARCVCGYWLEPASDTWTDVVTLWKRHIEDMAGDG